jgi:serine/threonine-protein kinase
MTKHEPASSTPPPSSELARVEARFAADLDLARTLVDCRAATISPQRPISTGGRSAVEALRDMGASLDRKLEIHKTLGEGGMGVVHLATQTTLGRHVAVKTLRAGAGDMDATLRILREAWVTGSLEHPNVVPIYDVGVDAGGSPVIVMKRIEGRHWGELIAQPDEIARRFGATDPLEWNLRILVSVCNAAHFAHSRDVLHRDLKPENVMIGSFGEVYVLDWGIAVSLREDPTGRLPQLASATEVAGTPQYMAPEMLLGDPSLLSPRTDVYLLGAILFEIFTSTPPHDGEDLRAMLSRILAGAPRFPASFPHEARAICERAMKKDPAERYESAEAFRRAIDEYLMHRGSRKLATEARASLELLLTTVKPSVAESPVDPDDRALQIANLLGECRFGYRAALAAWPGNEAARRGLDNALLAVIDYEISEGDAHAAATLLREMATPPSDVAARVDAAIRTRVENDKRLRKMEIDHDPTIGTRTRVTLGGIFGGLWSVSPLLVWASALRGHVVTYGEMLAATMGFLLLGIAGFVWARDTMTKTLLNRRNANTFAVVFVAQLAIVLGSWIAHRPAVEAQIVIPICWGLGYALLGVWAEIWFLVPAVTCAAGFVASSYAPSWMYPVMSLDNVVFTIVLLRVWLPKEELALIEQRRQTLRRRARRWLREAVHGEDDCGPASKSPESRAASR